MYAVKWNVKEKPQQVPADNLCEQLQRSMPVAVGTTPLDSLLAYVRVHQEDGNDTSIQKVMQVILNVQKYLLVQEDTVDGQEQADELLYNYNFNATSGGKHYHLARAANPKVPTEKPEDKVVDVLTGLNKQQARLDSLDRVVERLRWKLFARWWELVTIGPSDSNQKANCKTQVDGIAKKLEKLMGIRKDCEEARDAIAKEKNLQHLITDKTIDTSAHPSYFTQRDPTLLVGNIQSAWPQDWLEALRVRLNTDITTWKKRTTRDDVSISRLPENIRETVTALVDEFIDLIPDTDGSRIVPADTLKPLYHDAADIGYSPRRDIWGDTQPFFPLFLEWEAEYAHIDFSSWSLEERSATAQGSAKLRYEIEGQQPLYDAPQWKGEKKKQNLRMLSGRVLITPQPSFSLQAQIRQVFDQTPGAELKDALKNALKDPTSETELEDLIKEVLKHLDELTYLSSPLAGFHDHLLTMAQGTHIKPTVRLGGAKLTPISGAEEPAAGFTGARLTEMGSETDRTPYGTLVQLSKDTKDSPFKPVTHGQFKFTKLNIIDKFGQVINALDPRWEAETQYLWPCLSEYYAPQSLPNKQNEPNTVEKPVVNHGSHFAQISPHINQEARVNCEFVELVKKDTKWEWVSMKGMHPNMWLLSMPVISAHTSCSWKQTKNSMNLNRMGQPYLGMDGIQLPRLRHSILPPRRNILPRSEHRRGVRRQGIPKMASFQEHRRRREHSRPAGSPYREPE